MKKTECNNIGLIFNQVRKVIPEKFDGAHEWLFELEQEVLEENAPQWVSLLKGFMRGLWVAKAIGIAELGDVDKVLEKHGLI